MEDDSPELSRDCKVERVAVTLGGMGAEGGFVLILLFGMLVIGIRLLAGSQDRERITAEISKRGGEVIDISWSPMGKGWWGEKSDRIYVVEYRDASGVHRRAWCKTSMFSGVYFSPVDEEPAPMRTGDVLPEESDRIEAMESEIRRLRRENEELRNARGRTDRGDV